MATFTGADFALESVTPIGLGILRVKFTQDPRVTPYSPGSNLDSALNPNNYVLSGSSSNYVVSVVALTTDPQVVDLFLAAPLDPGAWSLAAQDVVEDEGTSLIDPTSLTFFVSTKASTTPVPDGAISDPIENVLRKFLNPALKGRGWDAMIAALAAGDRVNAENAKLAFDQLFICTASGKYLEQRAGDVGQKKPAGVDMADELFRSLAVVSKTRKLTQEAILEVLEIFYGSDSVRASTVTTVNEPYALEEGDELYVLLDEKQLVGVTFPAGTFQSGGQYSAAEAAATITRALRSAGSQAYAVAVTDRTTGGRNVQIYSGSLGLTSSVRIVGGRAQTQLLFPSAIFTDTGTLPTWDISLSPSTPGNVRFTITAGTTFDLTQVRTGDLAYIYGSEFEASGNLGTFEIQDVSVSYSGMTRIQWFEIANPAGLAEAGVVQAEFDDLMFCRPVRRTIYDQPRHVLVAQALGTVDVVIPATTQVVGRRPGIAAYLNANAPLEVTSLVRAASGLVTVSTADDHGLEVGDGVRIDGVFPSGTLPSVVAGTPSGDFSGNVATGTTDSSQKTVLSEAHTYEAVNHKAVRLSEGMLLLLGGQTQDAFFTRTNITNPVILEITSDITNVDGSRTQTYQWTKLATRTFHIGHREFAVSTMLDGRVLATGGTDGDDLSGTSVAAYDLFAYSNVPAVNTQVTGSIPVGLVGHAQATLQDGRTLMCGGWNTPASPRVQTYLMDPHTLVWSSTTAMDRARKYHALVALEQVQAIVIGGQKSTGDAMNYCELWDSGTDTWHPTGSMTFARYHFGVVKLTDGRVVVIGGAGYNPTQSTPVATPLSSCEIYDQATGQWAMLPSMAVGRESPAVVYLPTRNEIVVAGGSSGTPTTVEVLDLAKMKWRTLPTQLTHGAILSVGGWLGTDTFAIISGFQITSAKYTYLGIPGKDQFRQGGLNREVVVTSVPTATSFTYQADASHAGAVIAADGVTATPLKAPAAVEGIPGPFSYDTSSGIATTATEADLGQQVSKGQRYASIVLDDSVDANPALAFPDSVGYLAFNFGRSEVVSPVKYLGRLSDTELAIDASFKFTQDLPPGTKVTLLSGRAPFVPARNKLVGNFYATGSAAGRVAAQASLDDTVGGGLNVNVKIVYPGDRGLGGEGNPTSGQSKLSDVVRVFGGDDLDADVAAAQES